MDKSALKRSKIKTRDILIIAFVLVVALLIALISQFIAQRQMSAMTDGPYVVIQDPEGLVYSELLSKNNDVDLKTKLGSNLIKVQDGAVWVDRADCDNQVCVHTGKIANVGDMIVCLPHQVIVQIVAQPDDAALLNYGLNR